MAADTVMADDRSTAEEETMDIDLPNRKTSTSSKARRDFKVTKKPKLKERKMIETSTPITPRKPVKPTGAIGLLTPPTTPSLDSEDVFTSPSKPTASSTTTLVHTPVESPTISLENIPSDVLEVALMLAHHAERDMIDASDLSFAQRIVQARNKIWHGQVRLTFL